MRGGEPPDDEVERAPVQKAGRRRHWWQRGVTGTLGGAMVGLEQRVFANQPPPHELVQQHLPDQRVRVGERGELIVSVPPGDEAGERS